MRIRPNKKIGLLKKALTVLGIWVLFSMLIICGNPALADAQSVFEIEGNTAYEGTAIDDWDSVIPGPGFLGVKGILIKDPFSKSKEDPDLNIFKPSGKFGEEEGWSIKGGNVGPAQNELTNIYIYALTPAQSGGDSWIVMGMHRSKKEGTFDLDFELNQKPWTDMSRGPERTAGDIVVGFELSGNPSDAQKDLFVLILRYDPDSTGTNTLTTDPYIRPYGAGWWVVFENYADASIPGEFEATMNAEPFPAPIFTTTFDSAGNPVDTVEPFFFAEAALNLTKLGLEPGCPGFGTVHAKSRSSLEVTSDLKDLAGPVNLNIDCYIYGNKYEDMDGDGDITEDTDYPLKDWTINLWLDKDGDGSLDETIDEFVGTDITDINGAYKFGALTDGYYHIQEVLKPGWTQSYPHYSTTHPGVHENIPVDINHTEQGPLNFGNWRTATKKGIKFEDLDADGAARETDEPGLLGWTIYVDYDDDGTLGAGEPSAVSIADGSYIIYNIHPGTWKVREVLQTGWTNSYPPDADVHGRYHQEAFTSGAEFTGNNFGNWRTATKKGIKFEDLDADGAARETGEPGLSDWTIYVDYDDDGTLGAGEPSAVSIADGSYIIYNIHPGTWKIREVLQTGSGWTNSYPPDADVHGRYHQEIFTSGAEFTGNDFGNYQSADLEMRKSGTISYTIGVTNNGPAKALNVVVKDDLPGNLNWNITAQNPLGLVFSITGNHLESNPFDLDTGNSAEVTVKAEIPQGHVDNALLENTATVESDTPDPDTTNNSADADIGPPLP